MHIGALIDLAIIGRNKVIADSKQNVISWLGVLPSEEEIRLAGNYIYHHIPYSYGQIEYQEITNPHES